MTLRHNDPRVASCGTSSVAVSRRPAGCLYGPVEQLLPEIFIRARGIKGRYHLVRPRLTTGDKSVTMRGFLRFHD